MFESLIQWVRVVYAEELGKKLSPQQVEISDFKDITIGKSLLSLENESPCRKSKFKLGGPSLDLRLRSDNFKASSKNYGGNQRYENFDEVNLEDDDHLSSGQKQYT